MADIPNRQSAFPIWTAVKENVGSGVALVEAPTIGRASVAAGNIADVPDNIGSPTMNLVYMDLPVSVWAAHNSVIMNGNEYPEYINASVPTGKSLTINGGQRWLEISTLLGSPVFNNELPDDVIAVNIASGATLNLNADKTYDSTLGTGLLNASGQSQQYQLGGKNVAVVSGAGTLNADMGDYGNNAFVTATVANVKMGNGNGIDGRNFYRATGNSQGHDVSGGKKADAFEYNFEGQNRVIGTNKFDGKSGSTEQNGIDAIQLRNLPAGTKVGVTVNTVNGGGTFPDADMNITIKKPDGTELGTIAAKDMNYLFLLNSTNQGVAPQDIGAGNTRTYTIGQ